MPIRMTREQAAADKQAENRSKNNFPKIEFVTAKVDENKKEAIVIGRLIGFPFPYWSHSPYKYNPDTKKWDKTLFIDDEFSNNKFERIGFSDNPELGPCPWDAAKYKKTRKYAQNFIERVTTMEDGKRVTKSVVKILNKGRTLFSDAIVGYEESQEALLEHGVPESKVCTMLGGEVAYDIMLRVTYDPKQPNSPGYTITAMGDPTPISQEDIDLLAAVRTPTDEELEEIYQADEANLEEGQPSLRDYPDWFNYGYNIPKIFGPSKVKDASSKPANSTPDEDLDMSDSAPVPAAAARPSAPAARANPFTNTGKATTARPSTRNQAPAAPAPVDDVDTDSESGGEDENFAIDF